MALRTVGDTSASEANLSTVADPRLTFQKGSEIRFTQVVFALGVLFPLVSLIGSWGRSDPLFNSSEKRELFPSLLSFPALEATSPLIILCVCILSLWVWNTRLQTSPWVRVGVFYGAIVSLHLFVLSLLAFPGWTTGVLIAGVMLEWIWRAISFVCDRSERRYSLGALMWDVTVVGILLALIQRIGWIHLVELTMVSVVIVPLLGSPAAALYAFLKTAIRIDQEIPYLDLARMRECCLAWIVFSIFYGISIATAFMVRA